MKRELVHNLDAEKGLLGAVLQCSDLLDEVADVTEKDFWHPAHGKIWRAINACVAKHRKCDLVLATDELGRMGDLESIGGSGYLAEIFAGMPHLSTCRPYANLIKEASSRRRVQEVAIALYREAESNPNADDVMSRADGLVRDIVLQNTGHGIGIYSGSDLVRIEQQEIQKRSSGNTRSCSFGIQKLDWMVPVGMRPGDFWVLGARPSVGKTSFITGVASNGIKHNKRILHIACEMGVVRNLWRILCHTSDLPLFKAREPGRMAPEDLDRYMDALNTVSNAENYRLAYNPRPKVSWISSVIRRAKTAMGGSLDIVLIDYFQKVRPDKSRNAMVEERTSVVQDLVAIAGEEEVAILMGAQLNRDAETDIQKERPTKAELKGTGTLEDEATGIILLHRWGIFSRIPSNKGAEIIVAKQQDGPTGLLAAEYDEQLTRWDAKFDLGEVEHEPN